MRAAAPPAGAAVRDAGRGVMLRDGFARSGLIARRPPPRARGLIPPLFFAGNGVDAGRFASRALRFPSFAYRPFRRLRRPARAIPEKRRELYYRSRNEVLPGA